MDMQTLMKQAQEMQGRVAGAQERLRETVLRGVAAQGLAIAEMNGKYDLIRLTLAPALMKESAANAADVIAAAIRDAKAQCDMIIDKAMNEATGGMIL